jgi:hypothetical protein
MSASLLRRGHVIDNSLTVTEHRIDILLVRPEVVAVIDANSSHAPMQMRYSFSSPNQVCGVGLTWTKLFANRYVRNTPTNESRYRVAGPSAPSFHTWVGDGTWPSSKYKSATMAPTPAATVIQNINALLLTRGGGLSGARSVPHQSAFRKRNRFGLQH